jgi:hypothetical protein
LWAGRAAGIAAERKTAFHVWERRLFLILLAMIWIDILAGLVPMCVLILPPFADVPARLLG